MLKETDDVRTLKYTLPSELLRAPSFTRIPFPSPCSVLWEAEAHAVCPASKRNSATPKIQPILGPPIRAFLFCRADVCFLFRCCNSGIRRSAKLISSRVAVSTEAWNARTDVNLALRIRNTKQVGIHLSQCSDKSAQSRSAAAFRKRKNAPSTRSTWSWKRRCCLRTT